MSTLICTTACTCIYKRNANGHATACARFSDAKDCPHAQSVNKLSEEIAKISMEV